MNSLWISKELGPMQIMCMKSYLHNGHDFHLYTYGKVSGTPKGVVIRDANIILHEDLIFLDLKNSYATFSDWFRIALLYKVGGWWVDADTICMQYLNFKTPYVFASEIDSELGQPQCCNAVLKMPKKCKIGKIVLKRIVQRLEQAERINIAWTELGAGILSEQINIFKLNDFVQPPVAFCPVNFFNFEEFLINEFLVFNKETYTVHLWNKMWDWNKLSPNIQGKNNSFFEKIKRDYL